MMTNTDTVMKPIAWEVNMVITGNLPGEFTCCRNFFSNEPLRCGYLETIP